MCYGENILTFYRVFMKNNITIHDGLISEKIYIIRGKKVMLDRDLASLYGVQTKMLNLAVKRNIRRFPKDFMFRLTKIDSQSLRFQNETLKISPLSSQIMASKRGQHEKYLPHAFTEQGVAMLSSVLHSERAIQVNIQIMRMFTRLRKMLETHKELREEIEKLEMKYDKQFVAVFQAIKALLSFSKKEKSKRALGFNLTKKS